MMNCRTYKQAMLKSNIAINNDSLFESIALPKIIC